jgi:hypothetical protein
MARTASKVTLTPEQWSAVDFLATGGSLGDVQKATTVEAATVRAWLRDADFVAALNVRTNEVRDAHLERLRAMVPKALDTLEGLLESQDEAVRLRVASYVLKATALDAVAWTPVGERTPETVKGKWREREIMDALVTF